MTDPLITAARFLASQLEWLRHATDSQGQPYAVHAFAEIEACAGRLRSLTDGPRESKYLGPCGAPLTDIAPEVAAAQGIHPANAARGLAPCDGDIYAPRGGSVGRCRLCGAEVASADREAWLDGEVRAHAFRAAHIAQAYGLNVKTIRSWATDRPEQRDHTGKLIRSATPARLRIHATDRDGDPLFLVGDVLDLAAADAARREERRSKRARREAQAAEVKAEREARVVGYMAVHQRLRRERGPANTHPCARCDRLAEDWAYDHTDADELPGADGPYSMDPDRYLPLCRVCHKALDLGRVRVGS